MRSLHVFLVENHKDTVKYIQLFLEQLNYNVRFCSGLGEVSDCDVSIYIDIKRSLETCASVSERTAAISLPPATITADRFAFTPIDSPSTTSSDVFSKAQYQGELVKKEFFWIPTLKYF